MTSTPRVPPILHPYLSLPNPNSLILLTAVLGATTNWLLFRFLYVFLQPSRLASDLTDGIKIVLCSFLRDWDFWRDGGQRAGIDLVRAAREHRLVFVDGLTGTFQAPVESIGGDGLETSARRVLRDVGVEAMEREILAAVRSLDGADGDGRTAKALLVLDGVDFLLAATGVGAQTMGDVLGELREHVHATIVTSSVDAPLVQSPSTPLELDHAAFAGSLAHQAQFVVSLRLLDTGAARDVSGVLRVTKGAEAESGVGIEEKEVLYFVGGDGGVRVFERGA